MTVQVTTSTQPYNGNGVTTVFPIPFKWIDDSHIIGTSTIGAVATPLTQGIDYTLAGVGTEGGGEATFPVAPATGELIQFTRVVPITQELNLISNDGFPAETVEQSLDKITMILQQHQDILTGAIGAPSLGITDAVSLGGGADVYKQAIAGVLQFRSLIAGSNVLLTTSGDEITVASLAGGAGEVNTASNVGTGADVFQLKVGVNFQFRRLMAGSNITITENPNEIVIAGPAATGEANTASNVGTGSNVFLTKSGIDLQFRRINAGANITVTQNANDITIAGPGGEANTASNIGSGSAVFASKVGVDLRFRRLAAGPNITILENANDITISGPASSGEANTASNLASSGSSVFSSKVGVDLQFRRILAGTNITVTQNANDITIAGPATAGEANTASNLGGSAGLFTSKVGVDLRFKGLSVGAGISQSIGANDVTHLVDQAFSPTWTGVHTHNKAGTAGATPIFPVQITDIQTGSFVNGSITEVANYSGSLDIRKVSLSATAQGVGGYGNSALTVQHQVSGTASNAIANCAARLALETTQNHSWSGGGMQSTNDAVVLYMGLYNNGKGVGGFGIHLDGYHIPTGNATGGQTPSTYGFSAEMWNSTGTGFVSAFHARAINDAGVYQQPIDYAFLASRGGDGSFNSTYKRGLSLGSPDTGTVKIGVGLDTTFAVAAAQAIYMAENQEVGWSGTQHSLATATDTRCITRWSSSAQEFQIRNGGSNRISFPTASGATYLFDFASGSRWKSGAFTPIFVGAIKILADGGGTIYIPICSNSPP